MKISGKTMEVLENFAAITQSILFTEGKVQRTATPTKTLFATVEVEEHFPKEFGIYNLSMFLSLMSIFKDPDLTFHEKHLEISEGNTKAKYTYTEPSIIKHAQAIKDKVIELPSVDIAFELIKTNLTEALKSAKILSVPHMVIEGDGESIFVTVKNVDVPSSDKVSFKVGTTNESFSFVLDIDTLKFLNHDYDVAICKKGIVRFTSKEAKLNYFVPVQSK